MSILILLTLVSSSHLVHSGEPPFIITPGECTKTDVICFGVKFDDVTKTAEVTTNSSKGCLAYTEYDERLMTTVNRECRILMMGRLVTDPEDPNAGLNGESVAPKEFDNWTLNRVSEG